MNQAKTTLRKSKANAVRCVKMKDHQKSALSLALALLSRKAFTVHELEKRLSAKEYAREEISEAVARLGEWGYLNDRAYAISFCNTYSARKSRRKIREELRMRGVSPELIGEVLSECYPEDQELAACLRLAEKIKESNPAVDAGDRRAKQLLYAKIGRRLESKGYPPAMIHKVLQHMRIQEES